MNRTQALSVHVLLLCFTLLLLLKLDHLLTYSWWIIFSPLFLFHVLVARGRLSLPGLSVSHGHQVASLYVPLLIAFELLLCAFLQKAFVMKIVSLKVVFLPLLAFELTVLVHNLRMCKALLQEVDAIWEPLCHFLVAISMGFFVVGTVFTIRKISGDISSLSWWNVFIYFGIAECFSFLVWNNGIAWCTEDISENRMCGLQSIGGHVMKILIIVFQILLCMRLEGKPDAARFIPLPVVFSPVFLAQGIGLLFASSDLIKKIVILLPTEAGAGINYTNPARARDSFVFLQRGSRSREEQARMHYNGSSRHNTVSVYPPEKIKSLPKKDLTEEVRRLREALNEQTKITKSLKENQARMHYNGSSGYNTFSRYPPEIVKWSPEKDLTEEISRLRTALNEQTEITKSVQQNYESLQNNKNECTICCEREINTVLLPCSHHILCSICSKKCQKCPICRAIIEKRLPVYGV